MIDNWFEGEPITDVRLNEMVNHINSLAVGTSGILVRISSVTWVVPHGITSDTRLRVWIVGGGGDDLTGMDGEAEATQVGGISPWGYSVLQGYSGGQSVPIVIGQAGTGESGGTTSFDSVVMVSTGGGNATSFFPSGKGDDGALSTTAPAGIIKEIGRVPLRGLNRPSGSSSSSYNGMVIVEW